MSEEYVLRDEFNNLKAEVQEIKEEVSEYRKLLLQIDKKIDVINEKLVNGEKIDELKLKPLDKRIDKLENSQDWLWKTVIGSILGLAIKIIFDINK